ncbi:two-component sensor histidine kinase [Rhizobium sp. BK077]|nr:two-component sensor histidine kinase [Rhizobium sp. BK112]MBB3372107.1 two-component sensor histidine kinase [Rhizobium sp. BK077]MBB4183259.1 two-component sensor histidine kinase [Rhizobium sp. BK109]
MLAVTISIATQTLNSASSPEAFHEAFIGRLKAMSRTYGLLSREHWKEASVHELISAELSPFAAERITVEGPNLKLNPERGLALGMVIHELTTNAAKYGALSNGEGQIDARWNVRNERSDFTQATRSRTATVPFVNLADVLDAASGLLATVYPFNRSVCLLGVTLSSLTSDQPSDATESQPQLDLNL